MIVLQGAVYCHFEKVLFKMTIKRLLAALQVDLNTLYYSNLKL